MEKTMRKRAMKVVQHPITHVSYARRGSGRVVLRRLDADLDSLDKLTEMLHRAFARLAQMGLNCTCVDQSVRTTEMRAARGDCYVAACDGQIVGTMTLCGRDSGSSCELYHHSELATIRQFAVDPLYQDRGIGKSMLALADHWAATRGYAELALDTPEPAQHLVAWYRGQGFRIVDTVHFDGKRYDSVILSKYTVASRALAAWSKRIESASVERRHAA
jgi:GNAT superfamily N-acetyltransferase